jgi:hypothetical protein
LKKDTETDEDIQQVESGTIRPFIYTLNAEPCHIDLLNNLKTKCLKGKQKHIIKHKENTYWNEGLNKNTHLFFNSITSVYISIVLNYNA